MKMTQTKVRAADRLMTRGAFQVGAFKLKLHETQPEAPLSPIYFNLRNKENPKAGPLEVGDYDLMGCCLLDKVAMAGVRFEALAPIPRAGVPFVEGMQRVFDPDSDQDRFRILELEKIETDAGRCIVPKSGFDYHPGERVLLVDDLITGAHTKLEAIRAVESRGSIVAGLVVFLDREQGGRQVIEEAGYNLFAVFTITDLLQHYLWTGKITQEKCDEIFAYIAIN